MTIYNITNVRKDFPILHQQIHGKPLVYLDNAATTQKPQVVIDTLSEVYSTINANIHRGVHTLSHLSTLRYEAARQSVQQFINAQHLHEIVFCSGATAAINLLAYSFGERYVQAGDEIVVSEMEHHSNIVPWQLLCERKQAHLKILPFDDKGELRLDLLEDLISNRTKLICVTQVSNVLGTINPLDQIIDIAHQYQIPVLVDGAQGIQHCMTDVQALDCDFYVFSGHKIYGPTGIGVLYGKEKYLTEMPPWQGGGDMVKTVSFEKTIYADLPLKFEAGTANYVDAIALDSALGYLNKMGRERIWAYEEMLTQYAWTCLSQIKGLRMIGTATHKIGIASFVLDGIHAYDAGMILDKLGIAIRTGHLCAEPILQHFKIDSVIRASWTFYNTKEEIDALVKGIERVQAMMT